MGWRSVNTEDPVQTSKFGLRTLNWEGRRLREGVADVRPNRVFERGGDGEGVREEEMDRLRVMDGRVSFVWMGRLCLESREMWLEYCERPRGV